MKINWNKPVKVKIQMTRWKAISRWLSFPSLYTAHQQLEAHGWTRNQWGCLQKYGIAYASAGIDRPIRGHFQLLEVQQNTKWKK